MTRRLLALGACALALAIASGCKKESASDEAAIDNEGPPPIGEVEAQRGRDACEAFKHKVCACAEAGGRDDVARDCRLAGSRIEALELQLRVLVAGGDLAAKDRRVVQAEVRKIVKACIEDMVKLDSTCPR
jgi:hypothetical protein